MSERMAPQPPLLKPSWTMDDPKRTNRGLAGPTIFLVTNGDDDRITVTAATPQRLRSL